MKIEFTEDEFRHLLDLVYIGNWVINATRADDRIEEYDELESKVFAQCMKDPKLHSLFVMDAGGAYPSLAYQEGGIHEAIMQYEDAVFFDILAQELALRDMGHEPDNVREMTEMDERMVDYLNEFEENGLENLTINK